MLISKFKFLQCISFGLNTFQYDIADNLRQQLYIWSIPFIPLIHFPEGHTFVKSGVYVINYSWNEFFCFCIYTSYYPFLSENKSQFALLRLKLQRRYNNRITHIYNGSFKFISQWRAKKTTLENMSNNTFSHQLKFLKQLAVS